MRPFDTPYRFTTGKGTIPQFMEACYNNANTATQAYWWEAMVDLRFEVGDQTVFNDVFGALPINRSRNFCFNHIRPIVNLISGQQRKQRKSTIIIPVENGDEETADQYTKLIMWADRQDNVLETISKSFHGSLIAGMNLLHVWMDFRNDPINGDIRVDNCSFNSFMIDPYFKKDDLSDCNFVWKRSYVTKEEAVSLLPNCEEDIESMSYMQQGGSRDGKFQFTSEAMNIDFKHLLTYDEFYYRAYRDQYLLIDTQNGETTEWLGEKGDLEAFLFAFPTVVVSKNKIPTVKLAVMLQDRIMYDGPTNLDTYPFVPVLCYYHPELPMFSDRIQGIVRGLRSTQFLLNRRMITILDIFETQANSGWVFKEESLVDPASIYLVGQGRGIALKSDAQMTDVVKIAPGDVPVSMFNICEMLSKEMNTITGVNEEMIGSAVDDKAGILSMLRQNAGLTTLQGVFDNLDGAQKLVGSIQLKFIQRFWTPAKVARIVKEKPTDQFYNKAFGKYNVAIEDGANTTTARQLQFAELLHLHEAGVPIQPDDLLEASTVVGKKKIIENMMKAREQQQQLEQMKMQLEMQEIKARIQLAEARSAEGYGLAAERYSRVDENKSMAVDRLHQANRADDAALLDKVKALKELEDMDLSHLERLVNMANSLKAAETQASESGVNVVTSQPHPEQQPIEQQQNMVSQM
jgi:hypothetical protein